MTHKVEILSIVAGLWMLEIYKEACQLLLQLICVPSQVLKVSKGLTFKVCPYNSVFILSFDIKTTYAYALI